MNDITTLIRASIAVHGTYGNNRFETQPNWAHENEDLTDEVRRRECYGILEHTTEIMDQTAEAAEPLRTIDRAYEIPRAIKMAGIGSLPERSTYRIARLATAQFQPAWLAETLVIPDRSEEVVAMSGLIVAAQGLCLRFHKNDMWEMAFD